MTPQKGAQFSSCSRVGGRNILCETALCSCASVSSSSRCSGSSSGSVPTATPCDSSAVCCCSSPESSPTTTLPASSVLSFSCASAPLSSEVAIFAFLRGALFVLFKGLPSLPGPRRGPSLSTLPCRLSLHWHYKPPA